MKIIDKNTTYISEEAEIAEDVVIYPNNYIVGKCVIKSGTKLMPNNYIENSIIGENNIVRVSTITDSEIGSNNEIGPYAHLRPKSKVLDDCKVGAFVEMKNATIGNRTKVSHLAYVGDATVGEDCNVGCGVVFINYDGKNKHHTNVGNHCFIGSNCNLIAPVNLSDECYIAAGTTVTKDVPVDCFVIGRSRETMKHNFCPIENRK